MDTPYSSQNIGEYLYQAKAALCGLLNYLAIIFLGLLIWISVGLFVRFLRVKLGSKVKPSPKRAIIITGATSGLGLALTKRYYRKGFTVFAAYFNDRESGYTELQELAANQDAVGQSNKKGAKLHLVHMDVRSESSIDKAATDIEAILKSSQTELYCVVSNAGLNNECFFEINNLENILQIIQTNLTGSVMVAKRFTLPIIKSKGRIIMVSSSITYMISPLTPIYALTKAGIKNFADCLNEALKPYGASCRCVCPGNLINKSNMVLTAARAFQDSLSRMNEEEKLLYKDAIEDNGTAMNKQLLLRLNQMKEDPKRVAEVYGVDLKALKDRGFRFTISSSIKEWLISFLDGGEGGLSKKKTDVDEMGALTAFDQAICLRNPPKRCFPGNRFFQYIMGPLVAEYAPPIIIGVFCNLMEDRLRGRA